MIPTKEQEQALIKAYKEAGDNNYFGNGFNAGVKFALEYIKNCNNPAVSCRTSVKWFAEQMELKLKENDYKGGWARCDHSWLLDRLKQEVTELEKALEKVDNQENVIKEAADVANFALMIADLAGELYGS